MDVLVLQLLLEILLVLQLHLEMPLLVLQAETLPRVLPDLIPEPTTITAELVVIVTLTVLVLQLHLEILLVLQLLLEILLVLQVALLVLALPETEILLVIIPDVKPPQAVVPAPIPESLVQPPLQAEEAELLLAAQVVDIVQHTSQQLHTRQPQLLVLLTPLTVLCTVLPTVLQPLIVLRTIPTVQLLLWEHSDRLMVSEDLVVEPQVEEVVDTTPLAVMSLLSNKMLLLETTL